jgi:hypothetical protein
MKWCQELTMTLMSTVSVSSRSKSSGSRCLSYGFQAAHYRYRYGLFQVDVVTEAQQLQHDYEKTTHSSQKMAAARCITYKYVVQSTVEWCVAAITLPFIAVFNGRSHATEPKIVIVYMRSKSVRWDVRSSDHVTIMEKNILVQSSVPIDKRKPTFVLEADAHMQQNPK